LANARDAAVAEAARTQRIQQFMMQLFEGGEKHAGPAEELRVVTLVDRSAQQARDVRLGRALLGQKRYGEAEEHSLGGLRILEKRTGPSAQWLVAARQDFAEIYEALGQPGKALEYRQPSEVRR
jgi:hypothetical protein